MLGIAVVMLALVYLVVSRLTGSPWGRVLRAIRENEDTARASGKDTVSFRMQSFVLGGMIMGLGGAIFAHRVNAIAPSSFTDLFGTFLVWTMLMVGGSGNNRGAVLGALVVGFFWFGVPLLQEDLPDFLGDRVFMIRQLVIGLLIVGFLLRRPAGLLPEERRISRFVDELRAESAASRLWRRLRGQHRTAEPPLSGEWVRGPPNPLSHCRAEVRERGCRRSLPLTLALSPGRGDRKPLHAGLALEPRLVQQIGGGGLHVGRPRSP